MRYLVLSALVWWGCLAVANEPGMSADQHLERIFQEYLTEECRAFPLYASELGDRRFDDQLVVVTPQTIAASRQRYEQTLNRLQQEIDRQKLTRGGQIDCEIFEHHLRRNLWQLDELRPHELDPRFALRMVTEGTYLLLTQSSRPREENVRHVVARMQTMPAILAAGATMLKRPPRVFTETAIKQTRGAIQYYESDIFHLAQENPATSPLKAASLPVIEALRRYLDFLESTLLPRSDGSWRLGRERFAQKLELELEAGISADQVLQEAEAEAKRVEQEMYVIARQCWHQYFPQKPLPPDDDAGRRATITAVLSQVAQDHGTPESLLPDAIATVAEIKSFIAQHDLLRLPEPDQCRIIEMPEFQRGFSVAYLNPAPPLDPRVSSYYAISPPPREWDDRRRLSYFHEYNRQMLRILTIHEAYPGHYVQLWYSNRHPSRIRRVLSSGVFAEGWAVYTEQMMLDQGFGAGSLALRLQQLKFYLRAVVNAILDHKMHCHQMTDEEAMALLMDRAFQSEGEAAGKVIRAKLSSCQLSTYFVGRMAFYRLRQTVQREQGATFHLGRFHEAVLDHGTLPVKYLPELVRERLQRPR